VAGSPGPDHDHRPVRGPQRRHLALTVPLWAAFTLIAATRRAQIRDLAAAVTFTGTAGLELIDAKTYRSGVIRARYRPAR
jgi:hypothetical protein